MHVSLTLFSGFSRTRLSISGSRMWLTYCISHTLFCSRASDPSCYYCILITLYYNEIYLIISKLQMIITNSMLKVERRTELLDLIIMHNL